MISALYAAVLKSTPKTCILKHSVPKPFNDSVLLWGVGFFSSFWLKYGCIEVILHTITKLQFL